MTTNYELTKGRAEFVGQFPTLAAAGSSLPDGGYTMLRTYGRNRVLRLDRQVQRLEYSCAQLGMPGALSLPAVAAGLAAAVSASGHVESRVRLTFAPPRLFATVAPFDEIEPIVRERGVACTSTLLKRSDVACKDTRFAAVARRVIEELPEGVHEGLLVGRSGELLEGLTSNFFALLGGVLRTAGDSVLPGLTRELLLSEAPKRLQVLERPATRSDLPELSEAFLTSASRGVLAVVRIDDQIIGTGRPGTLTRELSSLLEARIRRELVSLPVLAGSA
jgi:branched-chain amino acid aminotransferase